MFPLTPAGQFAGSRLLSLQSACPCLCINFSRASVWQAASLSASRTSSANELQCCARNKTGAKCESQSDQFGSAAASAFNSNSTRRRSAHEKLISALQRKQHIKQNYKRIEYEVLYGMELQN
jgi:hypothetical protein